MARNPIDDRPHNREVENENLRPPATPGKPPRPATEPKGAEWSQESEETATDPGSGEHQADEPPKPRP